LTSKLQQRFEQPCRPRKQPDTKHATTPAILESSTKKDAFVLYGHVHMAKTAGSFINGALALQNERVCGHKGYSYDAFQANKRYKLHPTQIDSIGKSFRNYGRYRVPVAIMEEIGWEDCDYVSNELPWWWWKKFVSWKPTKVELHVPCRDPIDHILSQCNHRRIVFDCKGAVETQVRKCLQEMGRFSLSFTDARMFPNFNVKCFDYRRTADYVSVMGNKLQKKRVQSTLNYRPTNVLRDKAKECLLHDEVARKKAEKYLRTLPYYSFCGKCLNSSHDFFREH